MHFIKDFGEVLGMNDLCVLDFEKVLPTMTIHIYEEFGALIPLHSFPLRHSCVIPAPDQVKYGFICKILSLIVNFNILTINVLSIFQIEVYLPRVWISSIASVIFWKHENYAVVWHSHLFKVLVYRESVARVSIVEVEFRTRKQDVEDI